MTILRMRDMIVAYRVLNKYYEGKKEKLEIEREVTRQDGSKVRIYKTKRGPNWATIMTMADKRLKEMPKDEFNLVMGLANIIQGVRRMRHERSIDKQILGKMADLEILTDTGHLTTTFKDCLQMTAQDSKRSIEEIVKTRDTLWAVIVEYTRDEDFDNPKEYLNKKSAAQLQEYDEMARVVSRCILLDIVKSKEGVE
jgi:IS4 transposase